MFFQLPPLLSGATGFVLHCAELQRFGTAHSYRLKRVKLDTCYSEK